MGIALLCLIVASIAVGVQAQVTKGRTGAAWGLLTFAVLFTLYFFTWPNQSTMATVDAESRESLLRAIEFFGQAGFAAAAAIMVGWPVMAIIVATLPKRNS